MTWSEDNTILIEFPEEKNFQDNAKSIKKPCFPEEIDQAFDKKRTPS